MPPFQHLEGFLVRATRLQSCAEAKIHARLALSMAKALSSGSRTLRFSREINLPQMFVKYPFLVCNSERPQTGSLHDRRIEDRSADDSWALREDFLGESQIAVQDL